MNMNMHAHVHKHAYAWVKVSGLGEALPLADSSVDAVVCTLTLCSVRDPAAAVAEVRRGGLFLTLTLTLALSLTLALTLTLTLSLSLTLTLSLTRRALPERPRRALPAAPALGHRLGPG